MVLFYICIVLDCLSTVQADDSDAKREREREREMGLGLGDLQGQESSMRQPTRGVSNDSSESNSLGLEGIEIPGSMAPDCDPEAMIQEHEHDHDHNQ